MAETPAPFEPDRPDLALVQLRRVREAARERGEAPLRARGTGAGLAGAMAGTTSAGRERQDRRRPFGGADRDPATVSTVFGRLIRDRGWSTPVAVGSVLTRWAELVGPEIALHCRPESFEDSVVRVRTSSTAWATQLRLMSPVLLPALRRGARARRRDPHRGGGAAGPELAQGAAHRARRPRAARHLRLSPGRPPAAHDGVPDAARPWAPLWRAHRVGDGPGGMGGLLRTS